MNLLKYSLLAFLLGISVIAVSINDAQIKEADYIINKSNEIEEIVFDVKELELNKENFFKACDYYGVHHSNIVYAQALVESGHFTSNLFHTRNNFLGLWNYRKNEFYKFDHWTDCINAYGAKVQYKYKGGGYYQFLDDIGYAKAEHYITLVKKVENQFN